MNSDSLRYCKLKLFWLIWNCCLIYLGSNEKLYAAEAIFEWVWYGLSDGINGLQWANNKIHLRPKKKVVLTGHTRLRYYLNKIDLSETSTCKGCVEEPETAKYVLCYCPMLQALSARCLGVTYFLTPKLISEGCQSLKLWFLQQNANGWKERPKLRIATYEKNKSKRK